MLLLLAALFSLAFCYQCPGTMGTNPLGCVNMPASKCIHYYQLDQSSGRIYDCYTVNGECRPKLYHCEPICNGTLYAADCATAPRTYCGGYYSSDSTGSFTCVYNPANNKCAAPAVKFYCTLGGQVQCNGQGWGEDSPGCGGATTQADCIARWLGPVVGQKNQCAWDSTYGYCYVGRPCHY